MGDSSWEIRLSLSLLVDIRFQQVNSRSLARYAAELSWLDSSGFLVFSKSCQCVTQGLVVLRRLRCQVVMSRHDHAVNWIMLTICWIGDNKSLNCAYDQ